MRHIQSSNRDHLQLEKDSNKDKDSDDKFKDCEKDKTLKKQAILD